MPLVAMSERWHLLESKRSVYLIAYITLARTDLPPQVHVVRKPVVAILSTGHEIFDLHAGQKASSEPWGILHDKFVLGRFAKIPSAFLIWFSVA